jgi:hypothetical protein
MTRRDYVRIAAALRSRRPDYEASRRGPYEGWYQAVLGIMDTLAADNPRFDRDRFWIAADEVPA